MVDRSAFAVDENWKNRHKYNVSNKQYLLQTHTHAIFKITFKVACWQQTQLLQLVRNVHSLYPFAAIDFPVESSSTAGGFFFFLLYGILLVGL